MRCLIVDDDELSRSVLEDLVKDTDSLELIKSCEDAIDAFNTFKPTSSSNISYFSL